MIDEPKHFQSILTALHKEYPESPEEEIKKMAQLEFDVLYCYQFFSFENGVYKYKDLNWAKWQLYTYGRIDDTVREIDIKKALDGNVKRQRLTKKHYDDSGSTKYQYNSNYTEPKPSPFETSEYKKIIEMLKE